MTWIVRRIQKHQFGFSGHVRGNRIQVGKEPVPFQQRHLMGGATGKAGSHRIHGIPRAWDEDDVARVDKGQGDVADALLRPD